MRAEQRLWQEVILRALVDAQYTGADRENLKGCREAKAWLSRKSQDFCEVCYLAGWDPDFILDVHKGGRFNVAKFKTSNESKKTHERELQRRKARI